MFQFSPLAPRSLWIQERVTRHDSRRVSPFGHPRINAYVRLPEAFRSLSRPSSPVRAKASTVRPCSLDRIFSLRPEGRGSDRSTDSQNNTLGWCSRAFSRRVQHNTQFPRPKLSNSLFAASKIAAEPDNLHLSLAAVNGSPPTSAARVH